MTMEYEEIKALPARERAKELFIMGYNCAQAVAGAFAEQVNLPLETLARTVSALGGGMCRLRQTCGAISGAMVILGLMEGYQDADDLIGKKMLYAKGQLMAIPFQEKFGSFQCRELLGLQPGQEPSPEPTVRTREFYEKRPCLKFIMEIADLLEKTLAAV